MTYEINGLSPGTQYDQLAVSSYQDNGDAGPVGHDVSLTAVPEAAAPALSLLGLGFLLSRRRR